MLCLRATPSMLWYRNQCTDRAGTAARPDATGPRCLTGVPWRGYCVPVAACEVRSPDFNPSSASEPPWRVRSPAHQPISMVCRPCRTVNRGGADPIPIQPVALIRASARHAHLRWRTGISEVAPGFGARRISDERRESGRARASPGRCCGRMCRRHRGEQRRRSGAGDRRLREPRGNPLGPAR